MDPIILKLWNTYKEMRVIIYIVAAITGISDFNVLEKAKKEFY